MSRDYKKKSDGPGGGARPMGVGILIGFVWEWLREHKHRSGKSKAERELAKTQRDLRRVKGKQSEGKDEVLALLDEAS